MRRIFLLYPNKTRRLLEILISMSSWTLITMPFWLSFWHPAVVAYLIITFDVYWFYKSLNLAFNSIRSYVKLNAYSVIDWKKKSQSLKNFDDLYHVVIIPEYNEPIHILRRTLSNLLRQDISRKKLIVVLGTEAADSNADKTASILTREFADKFGHFLVTKHPLTKNEISGKSSNMAYAGREVVIKLKDWLIPIANCTVTSCDADALLHPKYFSCLSFLFLSNPDRHYTFYQGAILFYSNIWRIPLPNRVLNTMNSIWNLSLLSQPGRLINFSTYSLSLKTVVEAGFWGVDVIPEDYHLFFKVYFKFGKKVKTTGIFLPVIADAAESYTFWKSFINQYEQMKRWSWGVADVPYVIRGMMLHPEIPLGNKLKKLLILLEQHIFWPTNWFLLTLGSTIPPLINPAFARTVLGHNLSQVSSGILTISAIFLLVVIIIDWKIKPPKPKDYPSWKLPFHILQWITLPVFSLLLGALPGLDAHTRLLIGKKLKYRVTEKV